MVKIIALIILLLIPISNYAKDYDGIVPLKSTLEDVVRKFGLPENGKPENGWANYRFEDRRITFQYSEGPCNTRKNCECFVPANTIIAIYVEFEEYKSFSELRIDKRKFRLHRFTDDTTVPQATYTNEEEGIIYYVDESDDEILEIKYIPSKKDCDEVLKHPLYPSTIRRV